MQNVERVILERDYNLVHDYWQESLSDLQALHLFNLLKTWFEKKHHIRFSPDITKQREWLR